MIELRLLRYFVAIAEVEHVGRAAAVLHVSQSPLSRQLRALEDAVGLRLFDRERKRLRLTEAGRWFLAESKSVLAHAERLERDAARRARGEAGVIRVGFTKNAFWNGVAPAALRAFRAARPGVAIELRNADSTAQRAALARGEIDVGLVHDAASQAGVARVELLREPLSLFLPADHPLARRARVAPRDLDGADWVALVPPNATRRDDPLLAACRRAGFTPQIRFEATDQATVLGLVEAGMGAALLPASAARASPSAVVVRAASWLRAPRVLHAIRRTDDASPLAAAFVACLVDAARRRSRPVAG